MVKFYNWVGLSLLFILSCGNPINITGPKYSDVIVTEARFDDQLIVKGSRFKNIRAVAFRNPNTGQIIKRFKVMRYDDHTIIGEQLDYNKIPIPNLLDMLIDTAQGQSVIPVQFTINPNSVYTGAIQNGAITPTKFLGITTPDPQDQSVLTWSATSQQFYFSIPPGGGGGGSGDVTGIYYGTGIMGDGGTATGTVPIAVNTGTTGSPTPPERVIPFFNNQNQIILDSTANPSTQLLFISGSEKISLSNEAGQFKIINETIALPAPERDLITIDAPNARVTIQNELYVGSQTVCLADGNGCPTGIQPITGVAPILVNGSIISADVGTNDKQLVQLEAAVGSATVGSLPAVDGIKLLNVVTKINALDGITVSNGGIGVVDIGLAPAGATGSAQPWSPALTDISNIIPYPPTLNGVIISDGSHYVLQSGIPFTQSIGLEIGVDVQAFNQNLDQISAATPTATGQFLLSTLPGQWGLSQAPNCGPSGFLVAGNGTTFNCSDTTFAFKLKEIQFFDTVAGLGSYVGFAAPTSVITNTIWELPPQDGTFGQVLTTDGAKRLSWGTGNGDVRGPAASVNREVPIFSGITGKVITNSNIIIDNLVSRSLTPVVADHLPSYNGTTGNLIQDSGILSFEVVTNSGVSPVGNLPMFTGTGKAVQDSLIPSANVMTMATPSPLIGNVVTSAGGKSAQVSNIILTDLPTMAVNATGTYQPILSAANNSKSFISASYSIPLGVCPNGEILKSNGTNFICGPDSDTAPPVTSVFTRTGAVIAQAGDYNSNLVTSFATGGVSATTVQGAITELDGEKLALAGGDMTGTIKSTAQNALQVGPYGGAAGNTGEVHYLELAGNGIQYVGFKAPDSINTNIVWTLPATAGSSGTVLTSNPGDVLSWVSPSAIGIGDVVGPASSSDNAIARFNSTTGKIIKNSIVTLDDSGNLTGVSSINGNTSSNFVTMAATPTGANFVYLSNGNDKTAKTTTYTFPPGPCGANEILKTDGTFNFKCVLDTSGVVSFNGRTGLVVSQTGDYTGSMVVNTAAGSIAATNTQGAINELDTEKIAAAGGTMTGPLVFGNSGGSTGEIRYLELSGNGAQYVGFKAPDSINSNVIWTLPDVAGTNGQVLTTVGAGVLQWTSVGSAGVGDVIGPSSSTSTNLASFNGTTGKLIQDSGISSNNVVTMTTGGAIIGNILMSAGGKSAVDSTILANDIVTNSSTFSAANRIVISAGATKAVTQTAYTIPPTIGTATYILKSDGTNATWQPDLDTVYSVFGRTGAVVAVAGDYDAIQVDNTPAGNISAINVQAALNELDAEKLALAGGTMTGTLKTSIQDAIEVGAPGANTGEIRFFEASAGPNYAGFKSPAVLGANYILTLPLDGGTNGQILSTTGAGVLSWTTPGGGGAGGVGDVVGPASAISTNLASFNGATGKLIQDSLISSNNVMTMTGPALAAGNILVSQGVNKVAIDTTINVVGPGNNVTGLGTLNTRTIANWVDGPASASSTNLAAFNGASGKAIQDSGLSTANIPTMVLNATAPNQMILSGGVSKQLVATPYIVPAAVGASGTVLTVTGPTTTAWLAPAGIGDVVGPAGATNNALARFDTGTGKLIKNSIVQLTDTGDLTGITTINTKPAADFVTMVTPATPGQVMLSGGAKAAVATPYTFPTITGTSGQVLKMGANNVDATWQTIGGGDVTGPSSSADDQLAVFVGTTGKQITNVPLTYLNIVINPAASTPNHVAIFNSATGKVIADSGKLITDFVTGPAGTTAGNLASYNGAVGNLIQDSLISAANVVQNNGTATANAIARFDLATGKLIKNSPIVLDDSGNLTGVGSINGNTAVNIVTMIATPTLNNQLFLSNAGDKSAKLTTYTFPPSNGTIGQVLTYNALGVADWVTPAAGNVAGPATSTINNLSSFADVTGKVIKDSGINSANLATMGLDATAPNQLILSGGVSKQLVATPYIVPAAVGASGTVLTVTGPTTTAWLAPIGTGDVAGPAGATNNALARFDTGSGKQIKNSIVQLSDTGDLTGITSINTKTAADLVTMPTPATTTGQVMLSSAAGKALTPADYTFPTTTGTVGQVLKLTGSNNATWANGGGDVSGPNGGTNVNELAVFSDTTGKQIKNVTLTALNVVRNPDPVIGGNLASFNGTQTPGVIIEDSGVVAVNVISKTSPFTAANKIAISNGNDRLLLETPYGVPPLVGADGQILKLSSGNLVWSADLGDVTGPAGATDGNLAAFNGASGKIIRDTTVRSAEVMTMVGVAPLIGNVLTSAGLDRTAQVSPVPLANIPLMANPAVSSNTIVLSSGADKNLKTTDYTLPATKCPVGSILKTDASQNFTCVADTSGVTSFNSRTGLVMPAANDYTASIVAYTPTGAIAASTTQGAINELEAEKLALTGGTMTGVLTATTLITTLQNGVQVGNTGANAGEVRFMELSGNGVDYVGFKAPTDLAGNVIWTLPAAAGASGTILTTGPGNVLSWTSITGGSGGFGDVVGPPTSTDNAIARFDQTTGKLIQNSLVKIDDSGNISGAGTISSSGDLTVTGNLNVTGSGSFNGALSAQSYTNTSDKILKKDIEPFTGASSIIDKLMPVTFRWKSGDEEKVIGLIAQDIEKVIPEVVSTSKQKVKSYDLGQVLILTLEALKETREELKQTKTELKVMREKVQDLEKRIP